MQSSDVEFVRPTAMVTRAFGNGFCATIFFLIFLYFLARFVYILLFFFYSITFFLAVEDLRGNRMRKNRKFTE
uniref:Uncharacterized protein n=1 Tax=Ascaris lumbricoides TaxID=6252 RepID=A0A0M3IUG7_ASCLU